jgi:hypothetical protein
MIVDRLRREFKELGHRHTCWRCSSNSPNVKSTTCSDMSQQVESAVQHSMGPHFRLAVRAVFSDLQCVDHMCAFPNSMTCAASWFMF